MAAPNGKVIAVFWVGAKDANRNGFDLVVACKKEHTATALRTEVDCPFDTLFPSPKTFGGRRPEPSAYLSWLQGCCMEITGRILRLHAAKAKDANVKPVSVLSWCKAGRHRSAAMCAAALMWAGGKRTLNEEAIEHITWHMCHLAKQQMEFTG